MGDNYLHGTVYISVVMAGHSSEEPKYSSVGKCEEIDSASERSYSVYTVHADTVSGKASMDVIYATY